MTLFMCLRKGKQHRAQILQVLHRTLKSSIDNSYSCVLQMLELLTKYNDNTFFEPCLSPYVSDIPGSKHFFPRNMEKQSLTKLHSPSFKMYLARSSHVK